MIKQTISIRGMHCRSCEILVENNLKKINGVNEVSVNYKTGKAVIQFQGNTPPPEEIKKAVEEAGYQIGQKEKLSWISKDAADYKQLLKAGIILFVIYFIASRTGLFSLSVDTDEASLSVVLLVGLVAGISTCMALIGGLILALSARHNELHPEATSMQKFRPHLYFNIGRIAGFAILGGIIGMIGSTIKPSVNIMGATTIIVGIVMIFLGLKLIEIFPKLRDKTIALPKSVAKFFGLRNENREYSHRGALISGALSFFLPCGFTQAMQIYAIGVGSFWQGAAIMSIFALGTSPGLLGIGGLSSVFKGQKAKLFYMIAGLAVIVFGWINIANGSRVISGVKAKTPDPIDVSSAQVINMTQNFDGYSPSEFTVIKGKPVKWVITSETSFSCASSIVMPKYGIRQSHNCCVKNPMKISVSAHIR